MSDVGCAGILVSDTFCGPLAALPVSGQLVAVETMPAKAGGCAANVAIDLAKQGAQVDVVGCIGADADAEVIIAGLAEHRIDAGRLIRSSDFPTSKTVILIVAGEDRRYIHMFGANRALTVAHLDRDWLASLKVFYLGGLFALTAIDLEELSEALKFCRARGVVTVVDVVLPHTFAEREAMLRLLADVDYFVPNDDEAVLVTGQTDPRDQLRTMQNAGVRNIVITQGQAGVIAASGSDAWRCGAYRMQTIDPSGSGDAFASGIIMGILRGWDMPTMLRYASAIGASATRAVGTTDGVFTAAEAEQFLAASPMTVERFDL